MRPDSPASASLIVQALGHVAREYPMDRKLLVAPTFGGGRELLRRLATHGGGWVGFEVTTPRTVALRLAEEALIREELSPLDAFAERALLDEALDEALAASGDASLGELSEGVGFREAVHGAVTALRLAGVGPDQVASAALRDWSKRAFLTRTLKRFERLLRERRRADTAQVLSLALSGLDESQDMPPALGAERVLLMPGLGTRGLAGRLLEALRSRGGAVLPTDPVVGLEAPAGLLWREGEGEGVGPLAHLHAPEGAPAGAKVELFHAASIYDELREVLRRVVERGLRWDEVEIVTTDAAAYGSALHALATRLEIPVTYAVGLPVERTRAGRAVHTYLDWVEGGFPADPIRRLLEAGDLRPPKSGMYHAPGDLARRFRSLRVGWGRLRYRTQIREGLAAVEKMRPGKREPEEVFRKRQARARRELTALRSVFFPPLKATPSVPDRMGEGGEPVSPAELARGLRGFLRRVPKGRGPDADAKEALLRVLDRVEATLQRPTHFRGALTILRRHLEIRVRAPSAGAAGPDDSGTPWSSEGGHLHLSDVEHGGFTGRPAVFVVGADADRVPGADLQDPVLLDADRRTLGSDLPTSADLLKERTFRFAAFLSRLRGTVTLSYGAWDATQARSVMPSAVLLQALRLAGGDASVGFEALHEALGPVACSVPDPEGRALDADDVWMAALGGEGIMRTGVEEVRKAYPRLDRGLAARQERFEAGPGPHQGVLTPRPEELDPRRNPELVVSASRLEDLGSCPLRYLQKTVLRVRPPDDPELDPDRWLDPLRRGGLLHAVFEATLSKARDAGVKLEDSRFVDIALDALAMETERVRREVPSPGEGVRRRETAGLEEDVRSFVRMVREQGAPWVALELRFGLGEDDPLVLEVPGGEVRIRGAVDRVDEDLHGLHVIDYKTGGAYAFQADSGVFNEGRRLQHAIYSEAVERLLGGEVTAGEYHFPTRRGENEIHSFGRERLRPLPDLLGAMLDGVEAGAFVPTDDEGDCKFCDFAEVCRVRDAGYGKVVSPLAGWSEERVATGLVPALAHLKAVRSFEE